MGEGERGQDQQCDGRADEKPSEGNCQRQSDLGDETLVFAM
jgi:hypothetical protein